MFAIKFENAAPTIMIRFQLLFTVVPCDIPHTRQLLGDTGESVAQRTEWHKGQCDTEDRVAQRTV